MRGSPLLVAVVVASAPDAVAQVRGEGLVEITRADAHEAVGVMAPTQHGCLPLGDDSAVVLVQRTRFRDRARTDALTAELELWRADPGGATWRRVGVTPTRGDADGAIVRDGALLAVCWTASDGKDWGDAWFQRFDPAREAWLGEPERLTDATGVEDQYFVTDLARAANGALVAVVGCHRSPRAPAWTCGWSTGVRILPAGGAEWTPMQQANDTTYGVGGNALVRGERVDVTFRTCPSSAVHGVRTIDAVTAELLPPSAPITALEPAIDEEVANLGLWCGDDVGGRTLLFLRGAHTAGKGRLSVAHARGDGAFVVRDLADDPALVGGNETNATFTLARGPGDLTHACFARRTDDCAELWHATLSGGEVARAPRVVARSSPQAFAGLNGMRAPDAASTMLCVAISRAADEPGGVVRAFGSWPLRNFGPRARR